MILKITNDFSLILNKDDYQKLFVNAIDLLIFTLSCLWCSLVFLYYIRTLHKFVIIDDISSGECRFKFMFSVSSVLNVNPPLLPTNFVPILSSLIFSFYYIVTLDENDDLITSFEVALQTIRKVKARVINS